MAMARVQQLIRDKRRRLPFRLLASAAEKYLRAWHNEGFFHFDGNGERFAIRTFAQWNDGAPAEVWDVGAHNGEWATEVHAILPTARITSFEILTPLAERLAERMGDQEWLTIECLGLSDHDGEASVTWNRQHDTTNSIAPRLGNQYFSGSDLVDVPCRVMTADSYAATGKPPPKFLKIDVEGHEPAVFDGARELLSGPGAPAMIQFEYGDTWLPASRTLHDIQGMLGRHGYAVGRLYPNHVAFKDYEYPDDHFRMGNMIAVKDARLRAMLS